MSLYLIYLVKHFTSLKHLLVILVNMLVTYILSIDWIRNLGFVGLMDILDSYYCNVKLVTIIKELVPTQLNTVQPQLGFKPHRPIKKAITIIQLQIQVVDQ